jgi:hypothetical protein
MTISRTQNPLRMNFNRESSAAKEGYLKMFPNGLEEFERKPTSNNSFMKRFPRNTISIDKRSKSLSRPKITAGPGPRKKEPMPIPRAKLRKRTKKGPTKPTTKPRPRPRTIKLTSNLNLENSPLQLANKTPNTPRVKLPNITTNSNLSLLDSILKPMPTNTPSKPKSQTKSKGKSKAKLSNLGIAF